MSINCFFSYHFSCSFTPVYFTEGDGFGANPGGAGDDPVTVGNATDFKHYAGFLYPMLYLSKTPLTWVRRFE